MYIKPNIVFNPTGISKALIQIPNWVIWSLVKTSSKSKPQKRIVYIKPPIFGQNKPTIQLASINKVDPRQSFNSALNQYNQHDDIAGLGLLLTNNLVCIDLDDILNQPTSDDLRNKHLQILSQSAFTEVSQSGNGTHTFIQANIPKSYTSTPGVELYETKRFIAMTGHRYNDSPSDIDPPNGKQLIDALINEFYSCKAGGTGYQEPAYVNEGDRDNAVTAHCGYLFYMLDDDSEIMIELLTFNSHKCRPPLPDDQVLKIYNSIKRTNDSKLDTIAQTICHVGDIDLWFDLNTMIARTNQSLNTKYLKDFPGTRGKKPKITTWLPKQTGYQEVDMLTWKPTPYATNNKIIVEHNTRKLNTWEGYNTTPTPGDIQPWLDHLTHLIPEEDYRDALLWWIAFSVQCPQLKCQWHPIIAGAYGAGKDALFRPIATIFGNAYKTMGNTNIKSDYHDALYRTKFVHISEANNLRHQAIDFYKRITTSEASPNIMLNIKGKAQIIQENLCSVLAITNNLDAFKFDRNERRALVLRAPIVMTEEQKDTYFNNWLYKNGPEHLFDHLLNFNLDAYSPNELPYRTTHLQSMFDLTQSDSEILIEEMLEEFDIALPELISDRLNTNDNYSMAKIKVWLETNGWTRWDSHNRSKRIRRKIAGKMVVKSRDWYVRIDCPYHNSTPPDMFNEIERIEKLWLHLNRRVI